MMKESTIIEWFMKITLIISTYAFAYFVGYLIEEGDYALACLNAVSVINMMVLFKKLFYDDNQGHINTNKEKTVEEIIKPLTDEMDKLRKIIDGM